MDSQFGDLTMDSSFSCVPPCPSLPPNNPLSVSLQGCGPSMPSPRGPGPAGPRSGPFPGIRPVVPHRAGLSSERAWGLSPLVDIGLPLRILTLPQLSSS